MKTMKNMKTMKLPRKLIEIAIAIGIEIEKFSIPIAISIAISRHKFLSAKSPGTGVRQLFTNPSA